MALLSATLIPMWDRVLTLKLSCAMEHSKHMNLMLMDLIEQSVVLDKEFPDGGIIQFRNDPTTF